MKNASHLSLSEPVWHWSAVDEWKECLEKEEGLLLGERRFYSSHSMITTILLYNKC
jgi:hypothetical protein